MLRILLFLVMILAAIIGYGWMNATSLPSWYQQADLQKANDPVEGFSRAIKKQGLEAFFGSKFSDLLAGKIRLNEEEFNAMVLTSLASDNEGRALLSVSDIVRAQLHQNMIEIGSVLDIQKLKDENPELARRIDQLTGVLPIFNTEKAYLAVTGKPVVNKGELAIGDDMSLKIGGLTISGALLDVLGISLAEIQQQTLKLDYLKIKEITLAENQIDMKISPDF